MSDSSSGRFVEVFNAMLEGSARWPHLCFAAVTAVATFRGRGEPFELLAHEWTREHIEGSDRISLGTRSTEWNTS